MKTKVLFTAALMAAAASGAQAAMNAGSNMLVQLLESQRFEGVSLLADEDKVRPEQDNTDVTEWIVNPSFDENTMDGWTSTVNFGFWGATGPNVGTPEVYNAAFEAYQDLSGLPNGKYAVSVQAWANRGNRGYFYRNTYLGRQDVGVSDGITGSLQEVSAFFQENPDERKLTLGDIVVVDGNLRIAIGWNGYVKNSWIVFDNFKLTYVDDGYTEIKGLYDGKTAEIKAMSDESGVKPLLDRLQTLANEAVEDNSDALGQAYVDMNEFQKVYQSAETSTLRDRMAVYASMAQQAPAIQEAINAAIAEATSALDTVMTTAGIQDITNRLIEAGDAAVVDAGDIVVAEENFDNSTADGWNDWGTFGNGVMEFYERSFDFNRTFTNLPDGWYELTLNGFYRNGGADQGATYQANNYINNWRVYGNDYELPLMCVYEETGTTGLETEWVKDGNYPSGTSSANANFQNGKYVNTLNVWVSGGTLRVGVRGGHQGGATWSCLDNVKLTYKGTNLEGIYEAMAAQAKANAVKLNDAYAAKVETAVAHEGEYTVEAVQTLNNVLKEYVEVKNAIAQCNIDNVIGTATTQKNDLVALSEVSDNTTAAATAYEQAIAKAQTDLAENVTSVEDVNNVRTALEDARVDYLFAVNPAEGQQFDMTFLFINPNVMGWERTPNPAGWYHDMDCGNFQVQVDDKQAGETDPVCWEFVEIWTGGRLLPKDGSGWAIYQQVVLPSGAYQLSAYTFADDPGNNDAALNDQPSAWLSVGNGATVSTKGGAIQFGDMKMTTLSFYLLEASTTENPTKLGIYLDEENQCSWFGINDLKLYKVHLQAQDVTLNETDAEYTVTADTYANVTLNRTLKANDTWNSFCVPFDMTAEQLTENGITEVVALTAATLGEDGTTGNLTFSEVESIEAGKPYLVKVESEVTSIKVDGVAVHAATPEATEAINGVSMVGNYASMKVPQGAYFISDNQFYYADQADAVNLKGFRAYITVNETSEVNGANVLLIGGLFDDDVTGIEAVANEAAEADKQVNVYTIGGVLVKSQVKKSDALNGLTKGLYIVDGKKVVK